MNSKTRGSLRLVRWPNQTRLTGPYACVSSGKSSYEVLTNEGRYTVPAEQTHEFDSLVDFMFHTLEHIRDYPHAYRDDALIDEASKMLSAIRGIPE